MSLGALSWLALRLSFSKRVVAVLPREWKAQSDHFNSELEWFREEIRKAYGGRAPKVLDPFAGGGSLRIIRRIGERLYGGTRHG